MKCATATAAKPLDVLIIEDDEDDAFLLKRALNTVSSQSRLPLRIEHLPNGLQALSAVAISDLRDRMFDVLIVDLNMPLVSGGEFLRALRRDFKLKDVRAVVLTTSDQPPIHDAAREAGADEVFVKPNSQAELVAIARAILRVH